MDSGMVEEDDKPTGSAQTQATAEEKEAKIIAALSTMLTKCQRDINRLSDPDRNTRKRGLQKLIEDLPWTTSKATQRKALVRLISQQLLDRLLGCVGDSVEKCRELALTLLMKCVCVGDPSASSSSASTLLSPSDTKQPPPPSKTKNVSGGLGGVDGNGITAMIQLLCARVGEVPFPEPSEELRLQTMDLLLFIINKCPTEILTGTLAETIITSLSKALSDPFPSSKRTCADCVITLSHRCPTALLSTSFRPLLKPLIANSAHQHSKTRCVTLEAIARGCLCVNKSDLDTIMVELLPVFMRSVSDRSGSTRVTLSQVLGTLISGRLQNGDFTRESDGVRLDGPLLECVSLLLLLKADDTADVVAAASSSYTFISETWYAIETGKSTLGQYTHTTLTLPDDVEDGELELRKALAVDTPTPPTTDQPTDPHANPQESFTQAHISRLVPLLVNGIGGWIADSKKRYLNGLTVAIDLSPPQSLTPLLPVILSSLSGPIRDDETDIRVAAERACECLGGKCNVSDVFDLLLPRVRGEEAGSDTASQRTSAIRLLTHVCQGLARVSSSAQIYPPAPPPSSTSSSSSSSSHHVIDPTSLSSALSEVVKSIATPQLHEFREAPLREAILLLTRSLLRCHSQFCLSSIQVIRHLLVTLICLMSKCPGEDGTISDFAKQELVYFSLLPSSSTSSSTSSSSSSSPSIAKFISPHFEYILKTIHPAPIGGTALSSKIWDAHSPMKGAFEVLLQECPATAWEWKHFTVPIILAHIQPPVMLDQNTPEAHLRSYAAQRGEEDVFAAVGEVDVRLSLLCVLEGLIRNGSENWECSSHLSACVEDIMKVGLVPNLVWRIGRVESTVRKVALAACYCLLRAGAIKAESLFKVAPDIVPLLVSHLDDSDASPRTISCLCLAVIFNRLKGAFGEQAVHEMYPKLLKRLDDSSDSVRAAACGMLESFFQCAPPNCYSTTTLDYSLDQLFIHLDDTSRIIQEAVYRVIIAASALNKELVLKKCDKSRATHRSTAMCDKVAFEVRGYEELG